MKKNLVLFFTLLALAACSKYEDGGINLISSRQPKKVVGEWAVEKRLIDDVETPFDPSITKYRLHFAKNGDYKETYLNNGSSVVTEGTWGSDDKHGYSIYTSKGSINIGVLRLKSNSMWFTYLGLDNKLYELHLINARKAKD
jgi:hypothetical protein